MNAKEPLEVRIKLYGDDTYLSTKEAAQFMNVHSATVQVWRKKSPSNPPFSKIGGHIVYRLGDLKSLKSTKQS